MYDFQQRKECVLRWRLSCQISIKPIFWRRRIANSEDIMIAVESKLKNILNNFCGQLQFNCEFKFMPDPSFLETLA